MELSRAPYIASLTALGWTTNALCQALQWADKSIMGYTYMLSPDHLYYGVVTNAQTLLTGAFPIEHGNNRDERATVHITAGKINTKTLPTWAAAPAPAP